MTAAGTAVFFQYSLVKAGTSNGLVLDLDRYCGDVQKAQFQSQLPGLIAREWGLSVESVDPILQGMNSLTMAVSTPLARFVAKWVPAAGREALVSGAHAARLMHDHGIRAGAPLPTASGALTVCYSGGELVLLEEVSGTPLTASPRDQPAWGTALAAVHAASPLSPEDDFYLWLTESGKDSIHPSWVRRAVGEACAEYSQLPPLTWALLHTDPAPEAFLRDDRGKVGVIDWAGSVPGPVLYDVASAVMYAGGEHCAQSFLDSYGEAGVVPATELLDNLAALRRLRAAVQADYFSRRLYERNLIGIDNNDENARGLRDAREMLQSLGLHVD